MIAQIVGIAFLVVGVIAFLVTSLGAFVSLHKHIAEMEKNTLQVLKDLKEAVGKENKMSKLTPEELEKTLRNVFGIDGRGLKWKARRLYELLGECPDEVLAMCDKLGEKTKSTKENEDGY
jgi:hypothetical protein